jgi:hypothetical protein
MQIKQSTLTALAACLFTAGLVLLFVALYHGAGRGSAFLWVALALLIAAVAGWIASARAGS